MVQRVLYEKDFTGVKMNFKNKKILITGADGFLGKYVVSEFLKNRLSPKNIIRPTREIFDFRRMQDCKKAVSGIDIVIHLAARVGGIGLNIERPGELFHDNIIMGVQLMEAARIKGVEKFVGLGTVCAYPKNTPIPFKEEDLWDGYPEETNAPYGLAKKMLLVQGQAYRKQYGFNSIFLIPVNLYGPGDSFEDERSHVIPALIKKIATAKKNDAKEVEVWGTGKATREFLYVADAARAIYLATERYNKPDPVNLGSGKEISILNLVSKVKSMIGFKGKIVWNIQKPDGQPKRMLDVSKAWEEFGFKSEEKFDEGLKKTINWYRKNES